MKKSVSIKVLLLTLILLSSTFSIAIVGATEDSWTTLTPMPTVRRDFGVAVVDGKIYAIGGYNGSYLSTNEMYDPITDTWTTKASMPIARKDFAIAVYQNKIYIIGGILQDIGRTGLNQVYDPLTDTWENRTSMLTPRNGLCANVVNGKIYLIGGSRDVSNPTINPPSEKNEVYDPTTDTWTTKAEIPIGVAYYATAVVDNKIYILGGAYDLWSGSKGNFNQVYDPETDTWADAEPVPIEFREAAAGATTGELAPKRIYMLGGYVTVNYSTNPCNLTQVYDPEKNIWSTGAPMPTPHANFGVAVINDELYVISDTHEKYTPLGYIPEFPSWVTLPLFMATTLLAVISYRKLAKKTDKS